MLPVSVFDTPESFRDYFKTIYGPTIAVYRSLNGDADRIAALDEAIAAVARDASRDDSGALQWEYLLTVMRRR